MRSVMQSFNDVIKVFCERGDVEAVSEANQAYFALGYKLNARGSLYGLQKIVKDDPVGFLGVKYPALNPTHSATILQNVIVPNANRNRPGVDGGGYGSMTIAGPRPRALSREPCWPSASLITAGLLSVCGESQLSALLARVQPYLYRQSCSWRESGDISQKAQSSR